MGCVKKIASAFGATAAAGASALTWAVLIERRLYTLRRFSIPVLPPRSAPLKVLHLSDLHLLARQHDKLAFVESLAELEPDIVIETGDRIASADAVDPYLSAVADLLNIPGAFVAGSNDYFRPKPKNPARYLLGPSKRSDSDKPVRPDLPVTDFERELSAQGWLNLRNRTGSIVAAGRQVDLAGVDDPHAELDVYPHGAFTPGRIAIGVTHAPYTRVIDEMTADGADIILAGHTHGGQLCVPGYGALVTNCDIDRKRVKGLSFWRVSDRSAWLEVSAGLGTSPYAPARFACRPEATLLTLTPQS